MEAHAQSSDLIKELQAIGWTLDRVRGSHNLFRHPERGGHTTVPHLKKDLGRGLLATIRKQEGLPK